jgi:hypothetical protein
VIDIIRYQSHVGKLLLDEAALKPLSGSALITLNKSNQLFKQLKAIRIYTIKFTLH